MVEPELFIVVLLLPRNQSHLLPAYDGRPNGIRRVHKQIQAALGFESGVSARQATTLSAVQPDILKIFTGILKEEATQFKKKKTHYYAFIITGFILF